MPGSQFFMATISFITKMYLRFFYSIPHWATANDVLTEKIHYQRKHNKMGIIIWVCAVSFEA